jgi:16S rRNA (cytidine1402-2'-O)-methyltransferase
MAAEGESRRGARESVLSLRKDLDSETWESASATPLAPGLYLVATPIGNLDDITLRAVNVLRQADHIACEDTRQTQKLLNHFQIEKRTISYHEHNEHTRATELIQSIKAGMAIALVTDAGTPAVSDPGGWLVREAIAAGVPVVPIPGANAAITALIASGLPADEFEFLGFLPEKAGARRTKLEKLAAEPRESARTLIFYEAPHRILETLSDLEQIWGGLLQAVVARELTKVHEEFVRGTVAEVRKELHSRDRIRGEITLLIEAPARTEASGVGPENAREKVGDHVAKIQAEFGVDEKEALKRLARELGRSKSELYRELQRERAAKR